MIKVDIVSPCRTAVNGRNGSTLRADLVKHNEILESPVQSDYNLPHCHRNQYASSKAPTFFELSPFSSDLSSVSTPDVSGSQTASSYLSRKAKRISRIYSDQSSFDRFQALEVEPALLDYLVVHGALSEEVSKQILSADRYHGRSLLLNSLGLPSSEEMQSATPSYSPSFSTGFALLLNALRHTGHHSLASFLDCGRRITPLSHAESPSPAVQGEPTDSVSRRRGQISVWVRLEAIKVNPNKYHELRIQSNGAGSSDLDKRSNTLLGSEPPINGHRSTYVPALPSFVEYLQLDKTPKRPVSDVIEQPAAPTMSVWIDHTAPLTNSTTSPQLIDSTEPLQKTKEVRQSIGCFAKLCSLFHLTRKPIKHKKPSTPNPSSQPSCKATVANSTTTVSTKASSDILPFSGPGENVAPTKNATIVSKLELLDKKSGEFYSTLLDSTSALHDSVVRYFEQTCEVLVLDNRLTTYPPEQGTELKLKNTDLAAQIVVVATRSDLVQRLSDACKPNPHSEFITIVPRAIPFSISRLSNELRQVVIQSGVLTFLNLQDLRLSVGIDSKEVLLAIEELNDLVE